MKGISKQIQDIFKRESQGLLSGMDKIKEKFGLPFGSDYTQNNKRPKRQFKAWIQIETDFEETKHEVEDDFLLDDEIVEKIVVR